MDIHARFEELRSAEEVAPDDLDTLWPVPRRRRR